MLLCCPCFENVIVKQCSTCDRDGTAQGLNEDASGAHQMEAAQRDSCRKMICRAIFFVAVAAGIPAAIMLILILAL